jgi:hypothetical protein
MNEIVYDSENAVMTYSKSDFVVELIWKRNINSDEFRNVYLAGLDFAATNKVHFFLADIRNEGIVTLDDVKWLAKEVIAKANDIGIKKIALVNEDDLTFSSIYAESLKKKIENFSIQVNIFADLANARIWLQNKK